MVETGAQVLGEPAAVTAALVALAIGLSEVIKQLVSWLARRAMGEDKRDGRELTAIRDSIVAIAANLARSAEAQERLADKMERLDQRFEEHDREDAITFARMNDTITRVEDAVGKSGDAMLQSAVDHRNQITKLEHIEDALRKK